MAINGISSNERLRQTIESAMSVEAKNTFSASNVFRLAFFRSEASVDFQEPIKANVGFDLQMILFLDKERSSSLIDDLGGVFPLAAHVVY